MTRIFVAEPRAAYARRPALVVDASVLAAVIFAEPGLELVEASLRGRALHAPSLIDFELANVAWNKVRRRTITEGAAVAGLDTLAALDLSRHAGIPAETFALALRYDVTAYDAAYLWLADHLEAPLVTLDRVLAAAAAKHLDPPS